MHTPPSCQHVKDPHAMSQTHTPVNQQTPEPFAQRAHQTALMQRAVEDSRSLTQADVFHLQRTIGNRAVGQLLRGQPKLTVGPARDNYEREADRVAAQVVDQMSVPSSAPVAHGPPLPRQEDGGEKPQTKRSISDPQRDARPAPSPLPRGDASGSEAASTAVEAVLNRARGSGQPLGAGLQRSIGQLMGADFRGVRVHTDAQADQLTGALQAQAFTTGQDIFFRRGASAWGSRAGRLVLAHELVHVVQQHAPPAPATHEGQGRAPVPNGPAERQDPRLEQAHRPRRVQGRITTPAIQRLVGFEAELPLPTYQDAGDTADGLVGSFLFGGYGDPYNSVGGNALFDVGPDLSEYGKPISSIRTMLLKHDPTSFEKLKKNGAGKPPTLLEYKTKPVDELGTGSTSTFLKQFTAIKEHATQVISLRPSETSFVIPAPAQGMRGGIPKQQLVAWNKTGSSEFSTQLNKVLAQITTNDAFDIQATVGIMPSEIPGMFRKAVLATPNNDQLNQVMAEARAEIEQKVNELLDSEMIKNSAWYKQLSENPIHVEAFKGLLYLIGSYLIGHGLSGTTLVDTMAEKNMVPYLSKLKAGAWYSALPTIQEFKPDPQLVNHMTEVLYATKWWDRKYWTDNTTFLNPAGQQRQLILDPPKRFIQQALQGKPAKTQTGKKSFDKPEEIHEAASKPAGGQLGIQLEMRHLRKNLSLANLEAELRAIVNKVRDISMGRMGAEEKEQLKNTFE
jgi:Domain of unknown function (DUF4157)